MHIIALFGPTGVGKTAVAVALAELLRERGEDPVAVSADALQVYAGLETLTGAATAAEQAALEHRLVSFLPLDATFSVGHYAELAHAEIDALLAAGRRPLVGRHRPVPARRAGRARPAPAAAGGRARALAGRSSSARRPGRCTPGSRAGRHGLPRGSTPTTASGSCARWSCSTSASSSRPRETRSCGARELRHPTLLVGLTMEREALYARDRRARRGDARRGRARGGPAAPTPPAHPRRPARRSASRSCSRATSSA